MIEVRETELFSKWISGLRDRHARGRVMTRVGRLRFGNSGDAKSVGQGINELRIDYGPGYRVYFTRSGPDSVTLLNGGVKGTQQKDIKAAQRLAANL